MGNRDILPERSLLVANPTPEVRFSGGVCNAALYRSAGPDLRSRIRHCVQIWNSFFESVGLMYTNMDHVLFDFVLAEWIPWQFSLVFSVLIAYVIGKGKVHPRTGHECPEGEYRYSSTLSLTPALDEGGWSTPRPGRFIPWKETRYPLYRRLGGSQGLSGRLRKISLHRDSIPGPSSP
jgi:hypothetical protein